MEKLDNWLDSHRDLVEGYPKTRMALAKSLYADFGYDDITGIPGIILITVEWLTNRCENFFIIGRPMSNGRGQVFELVLVDNTSEQTQLREYLSFNMLRDKVGVDSLRNILEGVLESRMIPKGVAKEISANVKISKDLYGRGVVIGTEDQFCEAWEIRGLR